MQAFRSSPPAFRVPHLEETGTALLHSSSPNPDPTLFPAAWRPRANKSMVMTFPWSALGPGQLHSWWPPGRGVHTFKSKSCELCLGREGWGRRSQSAGLSILRLCPLPAIAFPLSLTLSWPHKEATVVKLSGHPLEGRCAEWESCQWLLNKGDGRTVGVSGVAEAVGGGWVERFTLSRVGLLFLRLSGILSGILGLIPHPPSHILFLLTLLVLFLDAEYEGPAYSFCGCLDCILKPGEIGLWGAPKLIVLCVIPTPQSTHTYYRKVFCLLWQSWFKTHLHHFLALQLQARYINFLSSRFLIFKSRIRLSFGNTITVKAESP